MKHLLECLSKRLGRHRSSSDLADEMEIHTSMEAEEMMERGLPQDEAKRQAIHRTGRVSSAVESVRDQEFMTMLESCWQDFRIGLRSLTKNPVFTVIAILTLAIGIGASTAIFSLLYGLLLRPLPVPRADRLARVELLRSDKNLQQSGAYIPYGLFDVFRQRQRSFEELAAISEYPVSMEDREGTQRFYSSFFVSGNFFSTLRIKPHRGRLLLASDDIRGGPASGWPIVLSYGFWMNQFKGDVRALGSQLRIGDRMMTVVGITPPEFHGLWSGVEPQLYVTLQCINVMVGSDVLNQPQSIFSVSAIGRLKPNVTVSMARQEISQLKPELLRQALPIATQASPVFPTISLNIASASGGFPSYLGRMFSQPLYIMQALTCVVLLLCCVNVGGLLMSKLYTRQRDFAIRTAVGAGRWRLTRQYLTESLLIAIGGILLGGIAAWYTSPLLLHYFRTPMMWNDLAIQPDFRMFLVSGFCCLGTTLVFGALPAWRAGRADVGTLMKSRTVVGEQRGRANSVFVPVQIGIALMLVALAAMLSQTLGKLRGERTGFDVSHITIQTAPLNFLEKQADLRLQFYRRMVERMEQLPGIRSAAITYVTPMTGTQLTTMFQPVNGLASSAPEYRLAYNDVGPGYFRTMKTRILRGREFERDERNRNVCVLNEYASRTLFPNQQAIGSFVRTGVKSEPSKDLGQVSCRVIGVAEDAKYGNLRDGPPSTIYFPITEDRATDNMVFLINSDHKIDAVQAYRKAVREIAPKLPVVIFATLQEQMDAALGSERLIGLLSSCFGIVALFLSAIGLYGLLSSSVAQRTGEIGVRIALGARRVSVVRMILQEALRLQGVGVLLGLLAFAISVQFISRMLYGVSAFDPASLILTVVVLTAVTLVASIIPALRAASVDPIQALRAE